MGSSGCVLGWMGPLAAPPVAKSAKTGLAKVIWSSVIAFSCSEYINDTTHFSGRSMNAFCLQSSPALASRVTPSGCQKHTAVRSARELPARPRTSLLVGVKIPTSGQSPDLHFQQNSTQHLKIFNYHPFVPGS